MLDTGFGRFLFFRLDGFSNGKSREFLTANHADHAKRRSRVLNAEAARTAKFYAKRNIPQPPMYFRDRLFPPRADVSDSSQKNEVKKIVPKEDFLTAKYAKYAKKRHLFSTKDDTH